MTDTATETVAEDETTTPFVEDDREIAYRSEATPQVSHGPAGRPAVVAPAAATGRRKEAVARVRIAPAADSGRSTAAPSTTTSPTRCTSNWSPSRSLRLR